MPSTHGPKKRVVIIGAGYAGVRVARDLARAAQGGAPLEVMLISDSEYHLETPLLYEVATAYLKGESTQSSEQVQDSVCVPLETIFAGLPIQIRVTRIKNIAAANRMIECSDDTTISYDTLVLAVGAQLATYNIPGVEEYAFSIKTLHESLELRHHIVRQFMMAKDMTGEPLKNLLTFVIVGAGAAGVEAAAELAGHIKRQCQVRGIDPTIPKVILVEAGPDVLKMAPPHLRTYTQQRLTKLGIQVLVQHPITRVATDAVTFANGEHIYTHTVIWTGGLTSHPLLGAAGLPLLQWGVAVTPTLQVVGHPNIFAAGDCGVLPPSSGKIPAIVPVAYTQGALVAANIIRQLKGEPLQEYIHKNLGALIATGGKSAVAIFSNQKGWRGVLPWLVKKLVTLRYWSWYVSPRAALSFWWRSMIIHSQND